MSIIILRESEPEKWKNPFEVTLLLLLDEGYEIVASLLDSKDKLVLILKK